MTGENGTGSPEEQGGRSMAWMQLLRLPNLLTVPGDAIAGFAAASTLTGATLDSGLALAIGAGLCLYMFGLVTNDVLDLAEDQRDRPSRPLPSGLVPVTHAYAAAAALGLSGVVLAFFAGPLAGYTALALSCAVVLYNALFKNIPVAGPLVMGLCRGLNVMLGAAATLPDSAFSTPVLLSALLVSCYIAALTAIAARETEAFRGRMIRFLPVCAAALGLAAIWSFLQPPEGDDIVPAGVLTACALLWPSFMATSLSDGAPPQIIQQVIGGLIRNLLFLEAALVAFFRPDLLYLSAALLLAFPISRRISRRFYAS
ncbi:MAG: UbiA family prenyltransferase [Deltaproteobacteria bacterium]|nr:UbiA family prenyltransferase [Deltaproteobacteria bacterium]